MLIGMLTALMVAVGGVLGGKTGVIIAFLVALALNFFSYWFSDTIAIQMAGAQPADPEQIPELFQIVERLSKEAGIPMPRVFIAPTESPNAFATGRNPSHASVAVTQGILRILNWNELEAVLAHELGHVKNRDVLICTMASVIASAITMLAHFGYYGFDDREQRNVNPIFAILLMFLAPVAAGLIQMAVSRSREYEADATGARLCHHPDQLASALSKLEQGAAMRPMGANPAFANLYIVRPDPASFFMNLMSTHPPIPDRIERLRQIAAEMHQPF
jgi:heat shock protein HtpX